MVLLGGWRRSRRWVALPSLALPSLALGAVALLLLCLGPASASADRGGPILSQLLQRYQPQYQAMREDKRAGGLTYKRNGGVPDECRGKYDTSIYTQLDNICEDCYNLYKEADVHQFCRADCFSTSYFQRCLQALLLEEDRFVNMAQIIGR